MLSVFAVKSDLWGFLQDFGFQPVPEVVLPGTLRTRYLGLGLHCNSLAISLEGCRTHKPGDLIRNTAQLQFLMKGCRTHG